MDDAAVAAVCGLVSGLVEWGFGKMGQTGKLTLDTVVGIFTGAITGLAYEHMGKELCVSSIILGTLYWFFYGTAFVIGLLEVVAGDLETGVTRFMAVSVKTFVLCLGSGFGLMLTLDMKGEQNWFSHVDHCGTIDLGAEWWRIPWYLLCSIGVLGQYRFPLRHYWRPLIIMLVAYEVQWQMQEYYYGLYARKNNMDYAASNAIAAMSAVITASFIAKFLTIFHKPINEQILRKHEGSYSQSCTEACNHTCGAVGRCLGLLRRSDIILDALPKLQAVADPARVDMPSVALDEAEEMVLLRAIVEDGEWSIWALLMPAVYQLVPGSMIAKLWFESLFPPAAPSDSSSVFANLMVIATSLAIGLIMGIAVARTGVNIYIYIAGKVGCIRTTEWKKVRFYD